MELIMPSPRSSATAVDSPDTMDLTLPITVGGITMALSALGSVVSG